MEGCTPEQTGQIYQGRQQLIRNNPRSQGGVQGENRLRNHQNSDGDFGEGAIHESTLNPYAPEYQTGTLREEVRRINMAQLQPTELMVIPTKVNGVQKEYKLLLDTGAQESLVSEKVVKELGLETSKMGGQLRGIGNDGLMSDLRSANLTCSILGRVILPDRFIIVSEKRAPADVTLGRSTMWKNKILINSKERKIIQTDENGTQWELCMAHPERGRKSHVLKVQTILRAARGMKYRPGDMLRIMVEPPGDLEGLNDHIDTELYYEGSNMEDKLQNRIEGWPGLMDPNTNSIIASVRRGILQGKIMKGDRVGVVTKTQVLECPNINMDEKIVQANTIVEEEEEEEGVESEWDRTRLETLIGEDSELSMEQKEQLVEILMKHQKTLSEGDGDIGKAAITAHRMELYNESPISQKPRRFPEPVAEAIEEQCKELYNADVIEPSKSPWSAPVVPVRKKDGTIRLCVDYRLLNQVTKPDRFPMPNVVDVIAGLGGVRYFTSLDLVRGYYQMPIEEESREYTAFSTPRSHWQFKRLPFGLKNSPAAFQREMQAILKDFPWKKVLVYIDDILLMEKTWEDHIALLDQVLTTLGQRGVKLKLPKCSFGKTQLNFLGHIVGRDGVSKSAEYIRAVVEYPQPTTPKQMQQFLGLVGFQRKFIPRCAELAKPLSAVTSGRRNEKLTWTEEMLQSFIKLKEVIQEEVKLAYPDYTITAEPLELHVDASGFGAGACLAQWQGGEHRVIAYASMSFSPAQQRYSTTEREIAALRWGVKTFRAFVYGVNFVIYTDHRPIVYLNNMKLVDSRLARTLEDLSDFSFTIKYCPGVEHIVPDALSRLTRTHIEQEVHRDGWLPPGLTVMRKVDGGADALFETLQEVMSNTLGVEYTITADELRRNLVGELLEHPTIYGVKLNKELRKSLRAMKSPGVMPTLDVIQVFATKYNCQVWMHVGSDRPIIFDGGIGAVLSEYERVHIQMLGGVHFNPVWEIANKYEMPNMDIARQKWRHSIGEQQVETEQMEIEEDELALVALFENSESEVEGDKVMEKSTCGHPRTSYWATTWVYGKPVCTIYDSGAEVSLLSGSVWEHIRRKCPEKVLTPVKTRVSGWSDSVNSLRGVVEILVKVKGSDEEEYGVPVGVTEDAELPCCLLLGNNFLAEYGLNVDFNECTIRRTFQRNSEIIHSFEIPEHIEEGETVKVHILGTVEVSDSSGSDEEADRRQGEYDKNIGQIPRGRIKELQKTDWRINWLRRWIKRPPAYRKQVPSQLRDFSRKARDLFIENDCLMIRKGASTRPVLPFKNLVDVVVDTHHSMAHIGGNKMKELLQKDYWHPELGRICEDVSTTCAWCQLNKPKPKKVIPPMRKIETSYPFELVAVDLVELPKSRSGKKCCLTVVDHYTKWVTMVPLWNKKGVTVAKTFERVVMPSLTRKPNTILSDNGPEFRSECFKEMLAEYGIEHVFTTPYKPSSNGAVERVNRTMVQFLKGLLSYGKDWEDELTRALLVYNGTYHGEIKASPCDKVLTEQHSQVTGTILPGRSSSTWKPGDRGFVPYKRGAKVMKKKEAIGNRNIDKFNPKYEGPWTIVKVNKNKVTYEIQDAEGRVVRAHHTQLREWKELPYYLRTAIGRQTGERKSNINETKHHQEESNATSKRKEYSNGVELCWHIEGDSTTTTSDSSHSDFEQGQVYMKEISLSEEGWTTNKTFETEDSNTISEYEYTESDSSYEEREGNNMMEELLEDEGLIEALLIEVNPEGIELPEDLEDEMNPWMETEIEYEESRQEEEPITTNETNERQIGENQENFEGSETSRVNSWLIDGLSAEFNNHLEGGSLNLDQEEMVTEQNRRRASSFNERYWRSRIISDWDASPIQIEHSDYDEQAGVVGELQNDDQITIFSAEEETEGTVGDFEESEGKEVVGDVLNRTLSILNTVVSVLDDMEQSREEPCLCSTLQLSDGTGNHTETEWQMFSDHKSEENSSRDFSGFQEGVINPLENRARNISARRRNLEQASKKIKEAKILLRRSAQLREPRIQDRLGDQETSREIMHRPNKGQETIESEITDLYRPHTRSRGRAVEIQNVQDKILEYKGGRKQN